MKAFARAALVACAGVVNVAHSDKVNPLGTVISLLDELTAKIKKEGSVEEKAYAEYVEWCDDTAKNTKFAIETASNEKAELVARIAQLSGAIEAAGSKVEDLAGAITTANKELSDATLIRGKEASDYKASEKELMMAISQLTRAVGILEKEMAKNPAAFTQIESTNVARTLEAFSAVLDAAAFSTSDQKQLAALVQQQQAADADDDELGSPAAAMYKTHSSNILDVLEDLKDKAEGHLSDLRKAEVNSRHNFEMLKQSLEDQIGADTKDMDEQKTSRAESTEALATAKGDLAMTAKMLVGSKSELSTAQSTCVQTAADHESTVAARKEELQVIAKARALLADSSSGAVAQTYSFLQVVAGTSIVTRADLAGREVIEAVRRLAKQQHSSALAQLASRIAAVARYGGSNNEDVFTKIKALIRDMIAKLQREAGSEATEKAYCDEQIAKTELKKGELEHDVAKMTSRIDKAASRSAQLKSQVKQLQAELAALTRSQAEMDKIRMETHEDYQTAKSDLELGLTGVRKALVVLRDYYGADAAAMLQGDAKMSSFMEQPTAPEQHSKASGAGQSVIDILQVVESDFATNLAKEESEEADAQSEHERVSQENAVIKTLKEQDVKYKTQEAKSQDATVAEYSADRESADAEYSAVMEFYGKIKERCIAKPETYEERRRRREAEISGLKEALSILQDETALVQRKHRGAFLGVLAH